MEILLPVSMVILQWVPFMAPLTTRPSHELKEDPVLYTLVTSVETGGACVLLLPGEEDAGRGVAAGFTGSPSPCLQSRRMWPDW